MHVRTDYTPKYTYIFTFIELLIYITYNIYFCISCKIVNIFHFLPSETVFPLHTPDSFLFSMHVVRYRL